LQPEIEIPENKNQRLDPTGRGKPGLTHGLPGEGMGLAHQDAAGRVFGQFQSRTELFIWSNPVLGVLHYQW
jgi:hypothetical protein